MYGHATAVLDRPPATTEAIDTALAHRENGRRLMNDALQLLEDGFVEGGEMLRWLSRLEYARALQALTDHLGQTSARTGP